MSLCCACCTHGKGSCCRDREELFAVKEKLALAEDALRKIYSYSNKPDWNMVMAIAGDIIEPMGAVSSRGRRKTEKRKKGTK